MTWRKKRGEGERKVSLYSTNFAEEGTSSLLQKLADASEEGERERKEGEDPTVPRLILPAKATCPGGKRKSKKACIFFPTGGGRGEGRKSRRGKKSTFISSTHSASVQKGESFRFLHKIEGRKGEVEI